MLRLNLLRNIAPQVPEASGAPAHGSGPLRPVLLILLGLLVGGTVALYLVKPEWVGQLDPAREAAGRADSLQRAEELRIEASLQVEERLTATIEWLYALEAVFPEEAAAHNLALSAFTPPADFLLRGTARDGAALSGIQESLVLIPGLDLKQSRAREDAVGFTFLFTGTVAPPARDSVPAVNRVVSRDQLTAELSAFRQSAHEAGVVLSTPDSGNAGSAGALGLRTYHLSGSCDSACFPILRSLLENERYRGSPLGIQRVTLANQNGLKTVSLDIMAFAP